MGIMVTYLTRDVVRRITNICEALSSASYKLSFQETLLLSHTRALGCRALWTGLPISVGP